MDDIWVYLLMFKLDGAYVPIWFFADASTAEAVFRVYRNEEDTLALWRMKLGTVAEVQSRHDGRWSNVLSREQNDFVLRHLKATLEARWMCESVQGCYME